MSKCEKCGSTDISEVELDIGVYEVTCKSCGHIEVVEE